MSDHNLSEFTKICSRVEHLNIANNSWLTDSGILSMVMSLKALRSLNIEGNAGLTDVSLVNICTHCAGTLQTLQIDCRDASDNILFIEPAFSVSAICDTLRRCTQLHTLSLKGHVSTEGACITFPLGAFRNLTTLTLNEHIYVENTSATDQLNAKVRTLKVDILHSVDSLKCLARISPLKEVHLIVNKVEINDLLGKYVEKLAVYLENFRPGLVFRIAHSGDDNTENVIMSV